LTPRALPDRRPAVYLFAEITALCEVVALCVVEHAVSRGRVLGRQDDDKARDPLLEVEHIGGGGGELASVADAGRWPRSNSCDP
jgi:hypothetical protein